MGANELVKYQFLRHCGQRTIAKQVDVSSRFVPVPHIHAPIVFYERDYHNWQIQYCVTSLNQLCHVNNININNLDKN